MDFLEKDQYGRIMPRRIRKGFGGAIAKPHKPAIKKNATFCLICEKQLSIYNKKPICWNLTCEKKYAERNKKK